MNTLDRVAEFLADRRLIDHSAARPERIKLHVLDTIGAMVAGSGLEEGVALRALSSSGSLACACAAARYTEIDDIHLSSCTTPKFSVCSGGVVPGVAGRIEFLGRIRGRGLGRL
jgi:hypothetical protein